MHRLGITPPRGPVGVVMAWPFEVFMAAVLLLGSALSVLIYAFPVPLLWIDMGPVWAVAWTVLALAAGGILVWGLRRGDLSALGAGLIMGGLLLGGYLLVATFNDQPYPTILSHALYSVTALMAIARGLYFEHVVARARKFRFVPQGE